VDQATYDPGTDTTSLHFTVGGALSDEFHNLYRYDSGGQFWKNIRAEYTDTVPAGDRYEATVKGNQTSATFAALSRYDDDFDGLEDGYEVKMTRTVVGNAESSSSAPGIPATAGNGIADSDEDFDNDGFPTAQEWSLGSNPLVAESTTDSDGDGLPDWFEIILGGSASPWDDSDGDGVPNTVEFDIDSNPALPDYGGYFPSPAAVYPSDPNAESAEFVSIQYNNFAYSAGDGPSGNPHFPTAGLSVGALGVSVGLTVEPSNFGGSGVANINLEIIPLPGMYYFVWPFSDDGDPAQGELQKPDPLDGQAYRAILLEITQFLSDDKVWARVKPEVLQLLKSRTLEHVSAVSLMKISYYCREIQWLNYRMLQMGAEHPAILLRIRSRASVIHTEVTKMTAVHLEYVERYPNLDYIGKILKSVEWFSFGASLYFGYQDLKNAILDYRSDVRNHVDLAGPAILSVTAQQLISDIPGMPPWVKTALSPTVPYFDPCPLGMYDGGGGCP
jgi:hypothetical protein